DADALLPTVRKLDHVVDATGTLRHEAHRRQPPLGVTGHGVLDLDDVGPPLGEHRPRRRHVRPRRNLDDAHTVHDSHAWPALLLLSAVTNSLLARPASHRPRPPPSLS